MAGANQRGFGPLEIEVAKGYVVVEFKKGSEPKVVAHYWEKFEAQDKAGELNQSAPEGVWYGWEMNR